MERVIKKDRYGNIACNNILIYTGNGDCLGENILQDLNDDWEVIKPEYYRYKDDNTILENWYDGNGIILNGTIKGYTGKYWTDELREEITYEEAMSILKQEQRLDKDLGYSNKDLMSRVITNGATGRLATENLFEKKEPIGWEKLNYQLRGTTKQSKLIEESKGNLCCETTAPNIKQNNNGGASDWYSLPKDAKTLQDLIEYRNMNGSVKDIFKACYRLGIKEEDELRDLNKMAYYSLREVGRITGRKDYITIAKELMGSQAIEKD